MHALRRVLLTSIESAFRRRTRRTTARGVASRTRTLDTRGALGARHRCRRLPPNRQTLQEWGRTPSHPVEQRIPSTCPCTSMVRSGVLPARRWSRSTFWVTSVRRSPRRFSRSAMAWCAALGDARCASARRAKCQAQLCSGFLKKNAAVALAMADDPSSVHRPPSPRYVRRPLATEMPAPVTITTLPPRSIPRATAS